MRATVEKVENEALATKRPTCRARADKLTEVIQRLEGQVAQLAEERDALVEEVESQHPRQLDADIVLYLLRKRNPRCRLRLTDVEEILAMLYG